MKYKQLDIDCYEGAILRKKDQSRIQQQKLVHNILQNHCHLYGFFIAILTNNIEIFQFICSAEGPGIPRLDDILTIIQICQDFQWKEGIISLLSSKYTKN